MKIHSPIRFPPDEKGQEALAILKKAHEVGVPVEELLAQAFDLGAGYGRLLATKEAVEIIKGRVPTQ